MKWEKLRNATTGTFKNPSFQSFYVLGKISNHSLRLSFKNPNFKSKDELRKSMSRFEVRC